MFLLIDRYISKVFLTGFVLGMAVFLTLFFVIDFITSLVRFDVGFSTLVRYYGVYGFQICYQLIPAAVLVGVVTTLSSLNRSLELTALFSLGMSLWRVLLPIFFWILILFGFAFFLGDQVVPLTKRKRDYIYYNEMKKNPSLFSSVKTDKIWYRSNNILFNIKLLDPKTHKAFGITFYYFSPNWSLDRIIFSKEAQIQKGSWQLTDGKTVTFVDDMGTPMLEEFKTQTLSMDRELSDIQNLSSAADFLSLRKLGRYIEKNKQAGLNMTAFEVDYHNKFSYPFTVFIMAFIAIPFVIGHKRSVGMAKDIFLILITIFIFWILHSSFLSFGRYGKIPPVIASWGPNLLMLLISRILFLWQKT